MATEQGRKEGRKVDTGNSRSCVDLFYQAIMDDPDAYMRFVAESRGRVRYWLRFYGSDIGEDDLTDLADEVYLRFLRYMLSGTFLPVHDGQIFKCLKTITKRVVSDYIRKCNRRKEAEAGFIASQQSGDPITEVENNIDWKRIASDGLHCQMIELRKSGKTYQEIADALGLKLYQVTAGFYKLRKEIKKS